MISVPGVSAERFKLDDARQAVDALGEDDSAIVAYYYPLASFSSSLFRLT